MSHHHLGLSQAGLEAPEVEVLIKGQKADARSFSPRQTVQTTPDGGCSCGHHPRVDGCDTHIYDEEVHRGHRGPDLHVQANSLDMIVSSALC